MYAVLCGENGRLCWSEVKDPVLKDDDVLLEIHAAALNRADLLQRAGQYPPPPGWPEWFGLEAAGIIRAMGPAAQAEGRWKIGDKACALLGGGGYAEYAAVPSGMLMPIPKGLTLTEAAALPEAFAAAYLFLFIEGGMKEGDTVLMQAGASGLASVVVPMARAFGARVITTVQTDQAAASIARLKADRVVVTARESLQDVMLEEKQAGRGVDIAIDCLGGEGVGECLPLMNRGGRWIMIATLAGDCSAVGLKKMYVNGTRLIGTTLRSRTPREKARLLDDMTRLVWPKVESGEVRPTIYRVLPVQEAEEAQRIMASGESVGKIVLRVRPEEED